ncbi:hypothetical protein HBI72_202360 [Parastagonospora nodorum]|nr:hypothetical protein HBI72_202360 [Parastagonospora nodorum]
MATEGSYTGKLALATLAADLGVTAGVLKVVLEEAFDIMQDTNTGAPGLFLHMALARRGYQVDGQVLYTKISQFRNIFARLLSDAPARLPYSQHSIVQTSPNSYQAMSAATVRPSIPQPQHTQAAMTWHTDSHPQTLSDAPSMASHYSFGAFHHQPVYNQQQPTYIHQRAMQTHHQPAYTHGRTYQHQKHSDWDQQLCYASQEDSEKQWR